MTTLPRLAACLIAALSLAACGQKQDTAPTAAAQTESAPASAAAPAPAETPAAAPAPAAEPGKVAAADGESVSDAPTGLTPIAAAVAANAPAAATPIPSRWVAGKSYNVLAPAQPTAAPADKVEVLEFFWYGCGHCYHLDPFLEGWKKQGKPEYAEFARVPVMWNDVTRAHARLFYTLEVLGKLEQLHTAVFKELHAKNNPLAGRDPAQTEQMQRQFAIANGIPAADFDREYRGFAVETKLQRAAQLTQRYRVSGVPLVAVNGRYTADVGTAGGEQQLLALINDLAASERKR
jgi:thiol:disulfide interchange protein DsbA